MTDKSNPTTHIDVKVVKNLLISRINEGKELMRSANTSGDWRRKEIQAQDRYRKAIKLIDEAISIKEGTYNEVSNAANKNATNSTEGNQSNRQTSSQNAQS